MARSSNQWLPRRQQERSTQYYELLEVEPVATDEEIKRSYRRLALRRRAHAAQETRALHAHTAARTHSCTHTCSCSRTHSGTHALSRTHALSCTHLHRTTRIQPQLHTSLRCSHWCILTAQIPPR